MTPAAGERKSHILDLIEDHCVENDIIDEAEEKSTAETAEVFKLKLEFELVKKIKELMKKLKKLMMLRKQLTKKLES